MSTRTLSWILWPIAGAVLGFFVSHAFCSIRGIENDQMAEAEVLVFGRVIHKESGQPKSGLSDRVVLTWGGGLNAGFSVLGVIAGVGIAALVNRASRSTASATGGPTQPPRTIRRATAALARPECVLAAVSTATFPFALLLPFFSFSPSLGEVMVDALLDYVWPGSLDPTTYSVLGGIARLFAEGDVVVAVVLLFFSVFFPAVKLALLWGVLIWPNHAKLSLIRGLKMLGPWSMADVFVVSVLVVAFKGFPGGTTFTIQIGYYIFLISVITGLLATAVLEYRLKRTHDSSITGNVPTHAEEFQRSTSVSVNPQAPVLEVGATQSG
jgi:hypothetical protein